VRRLLLLVVVLSMLTGPSIAAEPDRRLIPTGPATPWSRPGGPRVRPQEDRVASLLQEGLLRSVTLRRLAERLEAGDVIVYLELQPRLHSRLSGCVTWMGRAGSFRYVRASIAPALPFDAAIASIAHELTHAVEVLDATAVVDERTLLALYRRIGISRPDDPRSWDSRAAVSAGQAVRNQLRDTPVETVGAIEPLTVAGWPGWYGRQLGRPGA